MTVSELIAELQKHPPQKRVEVAMRSVTIFDEMGESEIPLSEEECAEADEVINVGAYVLVWGGKS